MLTDWYMRVSELLDKIDRECVRGSQVPDNTGAPRMSDAFTAGRRMDVGREFDRLVDLWAEGAPPLKLSRETRMRSLFNKQQDYIDFLLVDLPALRELARNIFVASLAKEPTLGFRELLHPRIAEKVLPLYTTGHVRDAVLNAITIVFDMIRERTKLDLDGQHLVGQAFSLQQPKLIFSTLDTESGLNDQKGFIKILEGAYQGIRNPKAHSLIHDLDERKAAEYLVFLSLLARRVDEAIDAPAAIDGAAGQ
jgi:uncharacterized protein (TIGR02391 family)